MRIVEARRQYIEWRVIAYRAGDFAHHGVAREPQLAHHLAHGAHHLRQVIRRDNDQGDYQEQEYFNYSQKVSVRRRQAP